MAAAVELGPNGRAGPGESRHHGLRALALALAAWPGGMARMAVAEPPAAGGASDARHGEVLYLRHGGSGP
jgi:hypothetical protein